MLRPSSASNLSIPTAFWPVRQLVLHICTKQLLPQSPDMQLSSWHLDPNSPCIACDPHSNLAPGKCVFKWCINRIDAPFGSGYCMHPCASAIHLCCAKRVVTRLKTFGCLSVAHGAMVSGNADLCCGCVGGGCGQEQRAPAHGGAPQIAGSQVPAQHGAPFRG